MTARIATTLRALDWKMLATLALLASASLATLASVAPSFFSRQLIWYAAAFLVILVASLIDWRWLAGERWFRYGIYGCSLILLAATYLQGIVIRGTKSWLVIGGFQFEPVELLKVGMIVLLAHFFFRRHLEAWRWKNVLFLLLAVGVPVAMVMFHPDLGSALIVLAVSLGIFLSSGIYLKRFLAGALAAVAAGALLWVGVLAPYQKARITGFLFPERDPLGVNYNVIQSKVAVGSGGLFGKGFEGGTQARLGFLPAAHNDFLFAAFTEEWGAAGAAVLLAAYLFFIGRVLAIGGRARENYSRLVAVGTATLFLVQFFVNTGSSVGILPVTGLPFPFFSYGGSSLLTAAALVGMIQHIHVESSS